MELQKLFMEREHLISSTNNAVNQLNTAGLVTRADIEHIQNERGKILEMTNEINRRMSQPTSQPVYTQPGNPNPFTTNTETRAHRGVAGDEYRKEFFNQFRAGFSMAVNYLRESESVKGGYLVPTEFHERIVAEMTEDNILRQISTVITTYSEHKISILANRPAATWVSEGTQIPLSSPSFDQISLSAYKLAVTISVSNELLADSYYDIEQFAAEEFGRALATAEEEAFLTGDGDGKPAGLIPALSADTSTTISTAGASIAADDVINLVHSLKRPYRKNAAFVLNDSTLAAIRKLKDSTQNFLWQPSFQAGEPERLLGYPVYTSAFVPAATSGNVSVLFGDFSCFNIGQRGSGITIKPLRELYALQDITAFLGVERVDGVLTDKAALRGLKMK